MIGILMRAWECLVCRNKSHWCTARGAGGAR